MFRDIRVKMDKKNNSRTTNSSTQQNSLTQKSQSKNCQQVQLPNGLSQEQEKQVKKFLEMINNESFLYEKLQQEKRCKENKYSFSDFRCVKIMASLFLAFISIGFILYCLSFIDQFQLGESGNQIQMVDQQQIKNQLKLDDHPNISIGQLYNAQTMENDADIDKIWKNGFYKSTLLINTFIFIVLPVYAMYLFKQILQEDQSLTQNDEIQKEPSPQLEIPRPWKVIVSDQFNEEQVSERTFYKLLKNIADISMKGSVSESNKGLMLKSIELLKSLHLTEDELRNLRLSDYFQSKEKQPIYNNSCSNQQQTSLKKKQKKKFFTEEETHQPTVCPQTTLINKENLSILKDIQTLLNTKTQISNESTGDEASSNNSYNGTSLQFASQDKDKVRNKERENQFEKTLEEYYKMVLRLPCAFCTIDYALFMLNFLMYSITDTRDISFCREYIEQFLMFAGFILFFAARDHISYYSTKFYEWAANCVKSDKTKKVYHNNNVCLFADAINIKREQEIDEDEMKVGLQKALNKFINSKIVEKLLIEGRREQKMNELVENKSFFQRCLWKGIQFGITAGNCLFFVAFLVFAKFDRESILVNEQ